MQRDQEHQPESSGTWPGSSREPSKQIDALSAPAPSLPTSKSHSQPSQRKRMSLQGIECGSSKGPNPDDTTKWIWTYLTRNKDVLSWWDEFWALMHLGNKMPSKEEVKLMAREQAATFWLSEAQEQKRGWWSTPPCLIILHQRDFISPTPPKFQGSEDIRITRQDKTKALAQEPCGGVQCNQRHPRMCCVGLYESSSNVSSLY